MSAAPRLGLFGGTFNPVHNGHLAMARRALDQCALDRLLWIPAGRPPHKPTPGGASSEDRVRMIGLAIAGEPRFALSRVDLDRDGPSYSIDTLTLLAERHPEVQTWHWLVGQDALADLPGWHRAAELIPRCRWIVAPRAGATLEAALVPLRERYGDRFEVLTDFQMDISSSAVRARIARGDAGAGLVPAAVAHYIQTHSLYRE